MNQIQEAIANVLGLDQVLEEQKTDFSEQLGERDTQYQELSKAFESLASDNALLQRQIEDLDYLNLYELNAVQDIMPIGDRKKTLARLRRLRHDNPLAKQAVKLVVRFTLGKGIQWVLTPEKTEEASDQSLEPVPAETTTSATIGPSPTKLVQLPRTVRSRQEQAVEDSANDPSLEILKAFWNDHDNRLAFSSHHALQQFLDDELTDGEKFFACFEAATTPYLRVSEIPCEEIIQTIYDPNNRLKPVYYKRQWVEQKYNGQADRYEPVGSPKSLYYLDYRITDAELTDLNKRISIPAKKIAKDVRVRHVMINEIWTRAGKRGLSELYASREWFRVFRQFMEGRAAINEAAQAISFVRKVKGGPTAVAKLGNRLGGLSVGDNSETSEIGKLTKPLPGAIYDSNQAVDLDWMKTDTGAVNAKEDARLLLMAAGAGVATMEHYFGEGGDANLATAQSMELPMVKSYEDWQQFIDDFIKGWFEYALRVANKGTNEENAAEEAASVVERIAITFPAIISQDVVKFTTAWAQVVRDIVPNNPAIKEQAVRSVLAVLGVPNINSIMPEILDHMNTAEYQSQLMRQSLVDNLGKPPVVGEIPNAGISPRDKAELNGKVPAANGPKPE